MLKFIKGIFDNRAEGEHRRRASCPKFMTAILIVQTNDRSGGPRYGLPGIREGQNTSEDVHLFSILRGNVRQGYFPIIRCFWVVLRLVLTRMSPRGLWRPVSGCRGLILLWRWRYISGLHFVFATTYMFFRSRWCNPRLIGLTWILIQGGPRFNVMLFMRVRMLFRP